MSVYDNCKQLITFRLFTIDVLLTLFEAWLRPTSGKIVLKRHKMHADVVAGLQLAGLPRTSEPVWSSRLQSFLTVLNFHPLSGYNWK